MKTSFFFIFLLCSGFAISTTIPSPLVGDDPNLLIGTWKLDLSPENLDDENFAMMKITGVESGAIKGEFYREGVKIREGRVNTQTGMVYGALVSGDRSGDYNTAFYFKNGKLYGSTHALERDFLSVWVGERMKE